MERKAFQSVGQNTLKLMFCRKEKNMSNVNKEIQKLANINEDACEFYEEAREKTENPSFQQTFGKIGKNSGL